MNHESQNIQPEGRAIQVSRKDESHACKPSESQGGTGEIKANGDSITKGRKKGQTINIEGRRFGSLITLSLSHRNSRRRFFWLCQCDCGNKSTYDGVLLRNGKSHQCMSCSIKNNTGSTRHGCYKYREYKAWKSMKYRCQSNHEITRPHYKERGITYCERWKSFENFFADMGKSPSANHEIDRKDNNGNYEPGNCRWATNTQNGRNRSVSKRWIINGVEYESLATASESLGVSVQTIYDWCEGRRNKNGGRNSPKPNCRSRKAYDH